MNGTYTVNGITFIRELPAKELSSLTVIPGITSVAVIGIIYKNVAGVSYFRHIIESSFFEGGTIKHKFVSGGVEQHDFNTYQGIKGIICGLGAETIEEAGMLITKVRSLGGVQTSSTDSTTHYKTGWFIEGYRDLTDQQVKDVRDEKIDFSFTVTKKRDEFGEYYEAIPRQITYATKIKDPHPDKIIDVRWYSASTIEKTIIPGQHIFLEKALGMAIKLGGKETAMELGQSYNHLRHYKMS